MVSSSDATLTRPTTHPLTRIRQGLRALVAPSSTHPVLPRHYAERLPIRVASAWHALTPYDRRHLIAVARDLDSAGQPQPIVMAGLLHDIGKAGRVTVVDRVAVVLIGRLAPQLRDRIAARSHPPRWLGGLHLLLRHAEHGANLLAEAGMPAEVTWLVRYHEREADRADLQALQAADHRH